MNSFHPREPDSFLPCISGQDGSVFRDLNLNREAIRPPALENTARLRWPVANVDPARNSNLATWRGGLPWVRCLGVHIVSAACPLGRR